MYTHQAQTLEGTAVLHPVLPESSVLLCKGNVLLQLPSAKECYGRELMVKRSEEGITVILGVSGENVLDHPCFFLRGPYVCVHIVSNGTHWVDPEAFLRMEEGRAKIGGYPSKRWMPPSSEE